MFSYDGFVAKTKLYCARAEAAVAPDEKALWQALALEFLLRAPLARQSPALLAMPEGDSLLYAVGVTVPAANVKSVPTKTVLERLQKVDAQFGADRAKQAALVVNLRNEELHAATAAFRASARKEWLPAWVDVVEEVCRFLDEAPEALVEPDLLEEARTYRQTSLGAIKGSVTKKLTKSQEFYRGLNPTEVSSRIESIRASGEVEQCPACAQESMAVSLGKARTLRANYDEDSGEIRYTVVQVTLAAKCVVCGLELDDTAEVVAAGLPRLVQTELSEDRYEGWRDGVDESELHAELDEMMQEMAYGEEYGNE